MKLNSIVLMFIVLICSFDMCFISVVFMLFRSGIDMLLMILGMASCRIFWFINVCLSCKYMYFMFELYIWYFDRFFYFYSWKFIMLYENRYFVWWLFLWVWLFFVECLVGLCFVGLFFFWIGFFVDWCLGVIIVDVVCCV